MPTRTVMDPPKTYIHGLTVVHKSFRAIGVLSVRPLNSPAAALNRPVVTFKRHIQANGLCIQLIRSSDSSLVEAGSGARYYLQSARAAVEALRIRFEPI